MDNMIISLECLAANAIIELLEAKKIRKINLEKLGNYGMKVFDLLKINDERSKVFIFSAYSINKFFINYSDFFKLENHNNQKYIVLKDEKNVKDLKEFFRWGLPLDILTALVSDDSKEVLL